MIDFPTYTLYLSLLLAVVALLGHKQNSLVQVSPKIVNYNTFSIHDYIALALICIIVGFRYDVGVDWQAYKDYFSRFSVYNSVRFSEQDMEYGYFLINYLAEYLSLSYVIVFSVSAAISWVFIFKSFPTKYLALTIYFLFCTGFFFWSMNGVRQFIAIGLFAYSIRFIIQKQFVHYLAYILIASFFHQSALLLVPLYFIPYTRIYNQKFWFFVLGLSFVFSQSTLLTTNFEQVFRWLSGYFPFMYDYNRYFDSESFVAAELGGTGLGVIFRMLTAFLLLFFSNRIIEKFPTMTVYFILFFSGIVLFNLFFNQLIMIRFVRYFLFFQSFVLSLLVVYLYERRNLRIFSFGLIFLNLLLFLVEIYNNANQCCPYKIAL